MANAANEAPAIRHARAAFVHDALKAERWSVRQTALAIGISHSTLGSRMTGATAFAADELESIAHLLKRDPVDFYAEYLNANKPARPGGGAGLRSIYLLDGNVGPARFELTTSTVESERFTVDHVADVIPLFRTTEPEAVFA